MAEPRSSGLTVRPALPPEYAAVDDLTAAIYVNEGYTSANYIDRIRDAAGRSTHGEVLVACDAGQGTVLGSVTLLLDGGPYAQIARPGEAEFRLLAVDPAARGRGAGECLVRCCIDQARGRGFDRLVLSTQPSMTAAHRLYERLGFRRTPERDWRLPHGVAMLVYTYDLRPAAPAR